MKSGGRFSIVDLILLVVVVPAAVIAAFCVPALTQVRELAKRSNCAANLNALGKGFQMYNGENADRWPWMLGKDWDATATGTNRGEAPSEKTARSVAALPFMLIRQDVASPKLFICPSDAVAKADDAVKTGGQYNWDFTCDTNLSYSYASPVMMSGSAMPGIVNGKSDQNLVVMADKTPEYNRLKADTDWTKPDGLTDSEKLAGMSQNHQGEYINMLFIDCHVASAKTPVVAGDNIYSASGKNGPSPFGSLGMDKHTSYKESYLIGPIRETKTTSGPATSSAPASSPASLPAK